MTHRSRIGLGLAIVLIVLIVGAGALVRRPAIAAIDPSTPNAFDPELVRRGRALAALGNCTDCHTVRGGQSFAGGLPVATPFGTVFSTNITPDPDTGIGRWSEAAFQRAMKSGVDRAGQHLYPTFPYDHFTHVSEADDRALYAYLMTRQPVPAPAPQNRLAFPYDQRALIAGWKLLFLRREAAESDPSKSASWNRGAYLVEGLAHCGACHTPRNALGAERATASFAGGDAENWAAYALNAQSPAPVPWTEDALFDYLRNGWQKDHGVARGPMAQVINNLSAVDVDDVRAIAAYTADIFGPAKPRSADAVRTDTAKPQSGAAQSAATTSAPTGAVDEEGAAIYVAACANCHETSRPLPYAGVDLHLSSGVSAPDPRNVANTVLYGLPARNGERSPIMPGFADTMTDAQANSLLGYLRARFSKQPAWTNIDQTVAAARQAQADFLQTAAEPPNIAIDARRGQP